MAFKQGKYYVYHSRDFTDEDALKHPQEQAWIVVKSMRQEMFPHLINKKGYRLSKGDVCKFGRVRFRVKEISSERESEVLDYSQQDLIQEEKTPRHKRMPTKEIGNQNMEDFQSEGPASVRSSTSKNDKKEEDRQCRICLTHESEENDPENPMFQPCLCAGTMQSIHYDCLK